MGGVVCWMSLSCKKDKNNFTQINIEEHQNLDSIIKSRYGIVAYSYEIDLDNVPAFSVIALNSSSDYMVKTRMAFLKHRFKWNFEEQLDSAFVFGIKENVRGRERHINFEVWNNVDQNNTQKVIDSLNILFDKPLYYKPPAEWQWFVYNNKVFFIDGYKAGVDSNLLREIKLKYGRDTLFLNYILSKVKNIDN